MYYRLFSPLFPPSTLPQLYMPISGVFSKSKVWKTSAEIRGGGGGGMTLVNYMTLNICTELSTTELYY